MTDDTRNHMTRWEEEGGSPAAPGDPDDREEAAIHALPAGYEEQPIWGFHDPDGHVSYQLHHVYGPPRRRDRRGPISLLDEQRSYWAMTWSTHERTIDQRQACRAMTYAQARKLRGRHLTFDQFSSMRVDLPELLGSADASPPAV